MPVNYQIILDSEIDFIKKSNIKPNLLLHVCCAPCSSYVLEYLYGIFNITVYFYNPNIYPKSEYDFRLEELKRLVFELGYDDVKIVAENYDNGEFESAIRGFENEPEGGGRCRKCFYLRLNKTFLYAKNNNFDYVTTTLSISPHKNAQLLNEIGKELSKENGVKYLYSDFKKKNGYKRSTELSKIYNLYRQNYCGCKYSKIEREKQI